ncbi:MAG: alpha/beta fold hydrolase [Planctomycetota bacterium]
MSADPRLASARALTAPIRAEYPFRPHIHEVDGAWLHYIDEGPTDAGNETLVFVHGNPTWSFAWRHLVTELSQRHRCIALDHVGCGLSAKPADYEYRLARHAENLTSLIDALGLERVTLVLHDWGGAIGMGFARRRPELVRAIAVLNTGAFPSSRIPLRIAACRWPVFGPLLVRGLGAFSRAALVMAVEKPLSPLAKRGYLLPYATWNDRVAVQAFVDDIPMDERHPSWSELAAIAAALPTFADRPTAAFWGMRDWCFTPAFLSGFLERWPELEVHCFEHAGHYLFEDEPTALAKGLSDFVARQPVASS